MQKYRITYAADVRMWKQHEIEAANDEEAKNMAHDLVVNIDGDLRKLDGKWITDDDIAGDDCILIDRLDANGEIEEEVQESTPVCDPIMDRQVLQDFVRQLARMDPPDEREEIAEIEGEIEAFSHMIRKAKEIMGGTVPAPAGPAVNATDLDILDWSGPEEGDTCDLSVWITDDCGNELYEITEGGDVESNKDIARRVVESINAIRTTAGRLTIEQATALVPEYAASVAAEGR